MLLMAAESYPGPGVSPGRVDQYLYPYYQADLEAGRLTREQAKEWLRVLVDQAQLCLRLPGLDRARTRASTPPSASSSRWAAWTQQGNDASNDLTYLMLDVIEEMNLLEPKPNVRIHARTPDRLLEAHRGHAGQGAGLALPDQL